MSESQPSAQIVEEARRIMRETVRWLDAGITNHQALFDEIAAIIQPRMDATARIARLEAALRRGPEWGNGRLCVLGCGGHEIEDWHTVMSDGVPCPDCGHKPDCLRVTDPEIWAKETQ